MDPTIEVKHYEVTDDDYVDITLPIAYAPIFDTNCHQILLKGGRLSGKTKSCILTILATMLNDPYYDWLVYRSTASSFRDSVKNEMESAINSNPKLQANFRVVKNPLEIRRIKNSGIVYFKGADSIGNDNGRTKGLKTAHPLKGIMVEETQQFRDKDALDQALASARRNFTDENGMVCEDWKILVVYNPPQSKQHWINQFAQECEFDPDWTVIDTSYLDILPFINDIDLKEIRKDKYRDEEHYKWFYLGKPGGGSGQVYPMLNENYLVPTSQVLRKSQHQRPVAIVVGCDGAVDRDCTEFSPGIVLEDGTIWFKQCDAFHWDPKTMGVMASYPLCEQKASKWFYGYVGPDGEPKQGLLAKYRDVTGRFALPIMFFVDDAATELYQAIKTYFGKYAKVVSKAHKGSIVSMVDCVRGAFLKDKAFFVDEGGWIDYSKQYPTFTPGPFKAYEQLRELKFDESRLKYDDTIPNDASDSVTYALWSWFRNPANIAYGKLIVKD